MKKSIIFIMFLSSISQAEDNKKYCAMISLYLRVCCEEISLLHLGNYTLSKCDSHVNKIINATNIMEKNEN